MRYEEYAAIDGVNWSTLKEILSSPLAYRHAVDTPRPDTPAYALGRAVHTLVLEPHTWGRDYAVYDGSVRRGRAWDAFAAAHQGQTILRMSEYVQVVEMARAVTQYAPMDRYRDGAAYERVLTWTDEDTGASCKGRSDWLHEGTKALIDLKTSSGGLSSREFGAAAARYRYLGQMAYYAQGVEAALGWRPTRWIYLVVDKASPHDVAAYEVDPETQYHAAQEVREALDLLAACRAADSWPGVCPEVQYLDVPRWYTAEDTDDALGIVEVAS